MSGSFLPKGLFGTPRRTPTLPVGVEPLAAPLVINR